VKRLHADGSVH